ncbi:MAG: TraR/DksA C4-type zinc finger protein [Desulfobacteraceae bacterium]
MDAEQRYMTPDQLTFFERKLFSHRDELLEKRNLTLNKIKQLKMSDADILDRSNVTFFIEQEVKASERYSQYLQNIETALSKIEEGTYGFCQLTGTEIGLKRLEAQPWAIFSMEALEELELSGYFHPPISKAYA